MLECHNMPKIFVMLQKCNKILIKLKDRRPVSSVKLRVIFAKLRVLTLVLSIYIMKEDIYI